MNVELLDQDGQLVAAFNHPNPDDDTGYALAVGAALIAYEGHHYVYDDVRPTIDGDDLCYRRATCIVHKTVADMYVKCGEQPNPFGEAS